MAEQRIAAGMSSAGPSLTSLGDVGVLVWKGMDSDERLFISVFEIGAWSSQTVLDVGTSASRPATARGPGDLLHLLCRGPVDEDDWMWYSLGGPSGMFPRTAFGNTRSAVGPALAPFRGDVYASWRGPGFDQQLRFGPVTGNQTPIAGMPGNSSSSPSIAEYGDSLCCAWKGIEGDERLFFSRFDGAEWTPVGLLPGGSSDGPALSVYRGLLFAAWKGISGDDRLFFSIYNGAEWTQQRIVHTVASSAGPALAAVGDKLILAWRGPNDDQQLYYALYDNHDWCPDTRQLDFDVPSINFDDGVPVGGHCHVTMWADGRTKFTGHFHDSGWPSYDMTLILEVTDADDNKYAFYKSGRLHGTPDLGSRNLDWDIKGTDPLVAANWDALVARHEWKCHAHAGSDWLPTVLLPFWQIGQLIDGINIHSSTPTAASFGIVPLLGVNQVFDPQSDYLHPTVGRFRVVGGPFTAGSTVTISARGTRSFSPPAPLTQTTLTSANSYGNIDESMTLDITPGFTWTWHAMDSAGVSSANSPSIDFP